MAYAVGMLGPCGRLDPKREHTSGGGGRETGFQLRAGNGEGMHWAYSDLMKPAGKGKVAAAAAAADRRKWRGGRDRPQPTWFSREGMRDREEQFCIPSSLPPSH